MAKIKSSNYKQLALIIVFFGFVGAMLLFFLVLPKEDFSREERKVLEVLPEFSVRSALDGSYERGLERYISDHFPFRKAWLSLDAHYSLISGRNGANGVYLGKAGYLIDKPISFDSDRLQVNINAVNDFAESVDIPVFMMAVPSSGFIMRDVLPKNHAVYRDDKILEAAKEQSGGSVRWINLENPFFELINEAALYYRTDHHWTSEGAYAAYEEYAKANGFEQVPKNRFAVTEFDGFYGTTYAKGCLWELAPDKIEIWSLTNEVEVEIKEDNKPEALRYSAMFFEDKLAGPDPYAVFLGGDHSFVRIINDEAPPGSLLVVKDSFANCMIPFLVNHYREIAVIDLRYFRNMTVSSFAEKSGIDQVLFLYGINGLVNDQNWIWLK